MRNDVKIIYMLEDPMQVAIVKDSRVFTSAQMQALVNTWITKGLLIKAEESILPNGFVRHRLIRKKDQGEA